MSDLRAGAAAIEITPPLGDPIAGYGARIGVSAGIYDPLFARALVLDDGATSVGVVICDLVGVTAELAERAESGAGTDWYCGRERLGRRHPHPRRSRLLPQRLRR